MIRKKQSIAKLCINCLLIVELEGFEPYSINSSNIIVYHNSYTLVYELGNFEANAILYVLSTLCLHVTQVQI